MYISIYIYIYYIVSPTFLLLKYIFILLDYSYFSRDIYLILRYE